MLWFDLILLLQSSVESPGHNLDDMDFIFLEDTEPIGEVRVIISKCQILHAHHHVAADDVVLMQEVPFDPGLESHGLS